MRRIHLARIGFADCDAGDGSSAGGASETKRDTVHEGQTIEHAI